MRFDYSLFIVVLAYLLLMPIFSLCLRLPVRLSMALSFGIPMAVVTFGWNTVSKLTRPPERKPGQHRPREGNRRARRADARRAKKR